MTAFLVALFSIVQAHVLSEPNAGQNGFSTGLEQESKALSVGDQALHGNLRSGEDPTAHVAFLVAGHHPTRVDQSYMVMDAILEFSSVPVQFYFLVDEQSTNLVALRSVVRGVQIVRTDTAEMKEKMRVVQDAAQGSGKTSIPKLYTSVLLPIVEKLIVLDSDLLVVNDIAQLWQKFDEFEPMDLMGLALSQDGYFMLRGTSPRKSEALDPSFHGFNVTHPGYNAGVMLQDLGKMREQSFVALLEAMVNQSRATNFTGPHPIPGQYRDDRSLLSEWPFAYPQHGVYTLVNEWNFQLCDGEWDMYADGPKERQQFQQLYNFPPRNDDKYVPSLVHGSCGSGKEFVLMVQKEPGEYSTMLLQWCAKESLSMIGKEFCRVCDQLKKPIEERLANNNLQMKSNHAFKWLQSSVDRASEHLHQLGPFDDMKKKVEDKKSETNVDLPAVPLLTDVVEEKAKVAKPNIRFQAAPSGSASK